MFTAGVTIQGRYLIAEEIGVGGMGIVYKAYDRLSQTWVALKSLSIPVNLLSDASTETATRYLRHLAEEFQTLSRLRHPNIISVLDFGFSDIGQPFLTMTLLEESADIIEACANRPLEEKISFVLRLLQALAYLHRRGIVHRDLKPENILIADGEVRLLDFGLSALRGQIVEPQGTIVYLAPEVFDGKQIQETVDLYSVGVLLYQLLTGAVPFSATTPEALIEKIKFQSPNFDVLPEQIQQVIRQLLAKHPRDRYPTAYDAILALSAAFGLSQPIETRAIRESYLQTASFVGRRTELERLNTALEYTRRQQGNVWLIGGRSGVGKSRLINELRINALVQRFTILRGQAVNSGRLPFQMWRDAIRRLLLDTSTSAAEASILKEIIPDVAELINKHVPDIRSLEGPPAQQRLVQTIVNLFRRIEKPTLLILEDLHWVVEDLELLEQITNIVETLPLMIVGSYRSEEQRDLPLNFHNAHTILLESFNRQEIAEMSKGMLGVSAVKEDFVSLLERETEGNAFFLVEVVRALADEVGTLHDIDNMPLPAHISPGGLVEVIQRRLKHVPQDARRFLAYAAVAGRRLDVKLLTAAMNVNQSQVNRWLLACDDAAVMEMQENQWRFTHDKLRETLLRELTAEQRRQINHTLATTLEHLYEPSEASDALLAEYWHAADNIERELIFAVRAAQRWRLTSSFQEIVKIAERVFESSDPENAEARELMLIAGEALLRLGNLDDAQILFERCLNITDVIPDPKHRAAALYGLGTLAALRGDNATTQQAIRTALDEFRILNDQTGAARCYNMLGSLATRQGNMERSQKLRERSLKLFRKADNTQGIADVLNNMGATAADVGEYEKALNYYQESYELRLQLGERFGIGMSLSNMGMVFARLGQYTAAWVSLEKGMEYYQEISYREGIAWVYNELGIVATKQEEYARANDLIRKSLTLRKAQQNPEATAWSYKSLGFLELATGDIDAALIHFGHCLMIWHPDGDRFGLAETLLGCGLARLAREEFYDSKEDLYEALRLAHLSGYTTLVIRTVGAIARLMLRFNQPEYAAILYGMLAMHPYRNDVEVNQMVQALHVELNPASTDTLDEPFSLGRQRRLDDVVQELLDEEIAMTGEAKMPDIYPQLKRDWVRDQQIVRYEIEALSVTLMMKWADDVFDLIQEHQHRVTINLLYNVSAPKVSMSYLVLTNRDMLAPGVTRAGRTRLTKFLRNHPHLHINLAVVFSDSVSGQIAERHNVDSSGKFDQIIAKSFFDEETALDWLVEMGQRIGRSTQPLRQKMGSTLDVEMPEEREERFGTREEIAFLINSGMQRVAMASDKTLIIGRQSNGGNAYRIDFDLTDYEGSTSVSRRHARLELRLGTLYLTDLNSTNGTFISGKPLRPGVPTVVKENDTIKIGQITMTIVF